MVASTKLPEGLTRADLAAAFNGNEKLIRAFEKVLLTVAQNATLSTANADATTELQDATAVTLSPNAALNNERVLAVASPLALEDGGPGNDIVIGFTFPFSVPVAHAFIMNLLTDTNITMPPAGRLMASGAEASVFANDAAAAAAGYDVGDIYKQPLGVVAWRQV
jgi:hypothetical protein